MRRVSQKRKGRTAGVGRQYLSVLSAWMLIFGIEAWRSVLRSSAWGGAEALVGMLLPIPKCAHTLLYAICVHCGLGSHHRSMAGLSHEKRLL